jgi:hypothetical protein
MTRRYTDQELDIALQEATVYAPSRQAVLDRELQRRVGFLEAEVRSLKNDLTLSFVLVMILTAQVVGLFEWAKAGLGW